MSRLLLCCILLAFPVTPAWSASTNLKAAHVAWDEGRYEEVITLCQDVPTRDRAWKRAQVLAGRAQAALRKYDDAEETFRAVVERDKYHVPALVGLARLLGRKRETAEAEALLKTAIKRNRRSVDAYREMGRLLSPIGRGGEARTFLSKAWKLDKKSIDTATLLVDVHLGHNDYTSARKVAQAIVKAHGKKADGYLLLGQGYEKQGKPDKAREAYAAAAKAEPERKEAQKRLAALGDG